MNPAQQHLAEYERRKALPIPPCEGYNLDWHKGCRAPLADAESTAWELVMAYRKHPTPEAYDEASAACAAVLAVADQCGDNFNQNIVQSMRIAINGLEASKMRLDLADGSTQNSAK